MWHALYGTIRFSLHKLEPKVFMFMTRLGGGVVQHHIPRLVCSFVVLLARFFVQSGGGFKAVMFLCEKYLLYQPSMLPYLLL